MYSVSELHRWGEIFTKNNLHQRLGINFEAFMKLSDAAKQMLIKTNSTTLK